MAQASEGLQDDDASAARRIAAPVIAFTRSDLRSMPRPQAPGAVIDFIEIRNGQLPALTAAEAECALWASPFQSRGWLNAWQQAVGLGSRHTPITAIGYGNGQQVFTLPLSVVRRFGANILTWCAYPQSDYTAPVFAKGWSARIGDLDGASILRQIASRIGDIDLIYMPKQLASLDGAANPFVLPDAVPYHVGAHAINFTAGESWDEQLKHRRSTKTRKRLKEKRSALEKLGEVRFRIATSEADARLIVDRCLAAKTEQLAKLGHWDPFSPPGVRGLLLDYFSANVAQSTWAVALDAGDKPAAMAFGFRDGEQWLLYQMAMPSGPEGKHSPGTHLLMDLMQHCTAQGVRRLDLALGDESYKAEWCDEDMRLLISTLALSPRGRLLEKLVRLRAALRMKMTTDPVLYERAKWVKGLARKIRLPF